VHLKDVRRISDSNLVGPLKQSLVALSLFANDAGSCYPSINSIARRAGVSPSTARRAIHSLEASGNISSALREGCSTVYQIHLDVLVPLPLCHPLQSDTPSTVTGVPLPPCKGTPCTVTAEPVKEPVKEPVRIEAPARPATAEGKRWLALLTRWSSTEAPSDRRWQVQPDADLAWFTSTVLAQVPAGVDVIDQLDRIDNWLEGEARKTSRSKFWKTIGGAKNGTKRWLLKARPVNGTPHPAADPAAAGKAWESIRPLMGLGPKFIDEASDDQLPHREAMRAGLSAIGGIRAWGSMSDRDRHFARPAFVKAFDREQGRVG